MTRMPTFFIPHGGGPCFFMDWEPKGTWDVMADWLRNWPATLPEKPRTLLVISGHWEEKQATVGTHPQPPLIYDYNGFPPHTYQLTWPAPGAPEIGARVLQLLADAKIPAAENPSRGFDHGVFIPLKVAFPDAEIPTVQLSLRRDLDAAAHLAIGHALAPLRDEAVLIIGSGMSYHNMRGYNWDNTPVEGAKPFDQWLTHAVTAAPAEREQLLAHWLDAPGARKAHPREEHLLPLMIAAGAAGDDKGEVVLQDQVLGAPISAYRFG